VKTVDDSAVSPRLGVIWDPKGDGAHRFSASYSRFAEGRSGAGDQRAGRPLFVVLLGLPRTGDQPLGTPNDQPS
jgi:outer membrane receptor protein involved in Fe transport